MKILVFGANGQLGWELMRRFKNKSIHVLGLDLPDDDITDRAHVLSLITDEKPDYVINTSAYTAVDRAETDIDAAYKVNKEGPGHIAKGCALEKIPLIHISTDYVFDGKKNEPYRVDDPVKPIGVYGKSKEAGEQEVRQNIHEHIIIRTSWLYGVHGQNFVKTMMRLGKEKDIIRVVNDQFGSPTFAGDLADAITVIIDSLNNDKEGRWGTYHYSGRGVTTWYEFAKRIIDVARKYTPMKVKDILPISTEEYPTPAQRPLYSVLDCTCIEDQFNIKSRPWQESLDEMMTEVLTSAR